MFLVLTNECDFYRKHTSDRKKSIIFVRLHLNLYTSNRRSSKSKHILSDDFRFWKRLRNTYMADFTLEFSSSSYQRDEFIGDNLRHRRIDDEGKSGLGHRPSLGLN